MIGEHEHDEHPMSRGGRPALMVWVGQQPRIGLGWCSPPIRDDTDRLQLSMDVAISIGKEHNLDIVDLLLAGATIADAEMSGFGREQVLAAREEISRRILRFSAKGESGKPGPRNVASYLAIMMLEASAEDGVPVPPSLPKVMRRHLIESNPRLLEATRCEFEREHLVDSAMKAFAPGESISNRKGAKRLGVSEKKMGSLLSGWGFAEHVEDRRRGHVFVVGLSQEEEQELKKLFNCADLSAEEIDEFLAHASPEVARKLKRALRILDDNRLASPPIGGAC